MLSKTSASPGTQAARSIDKTTHSSRTGVQNPGLVSAQGGGRKKQSHALCGTWIHSVPAV